MHFCTCFQSCLAVNSYKYLEVKNHGILKLKHQPVAPCNRNLQPQQTHFMSKCWKVDTSLTAFTVRTNPIIIHIAYDIYFITLRCKIDQIQICMAMSYFDIDTESSESSSALNTELSDCSVSTTELSDRSCI